MINTRHLHRYINVILHTEQEELVVVIVLLFQRDSNEDKQLRTRRGQPAQTRRLLIALVNTLAVCVHDLGFHRGISLSLSLFNKGVYVEFDDCATISSVYVKQCIEQTDRSPSN